MRSGKVGNQDMESYRHLIEEDRCFVYATNRYGIDQKKMRSVWSVLDRLLPRPVSTGN